MAASVPVERQTHPRLTADAGAILGYGEVLADTEEDNLDSLWQEHGTALLITKNARAAVEAQASVFKNIEAMVLTDTPSPNRSSKQVKRRDRRSVSLGLRQSNGNFLVQNSQPREVTSAAERCVASWRQDQHYFKELVQRRKEALKEEEQRLSARLISEREAADLRIANQRKEEMDEWQQKVAENRRQHLMRRKAKHELDREHEQWIGLQQMQYAEEEKEGFAEQSARGRVATGGLGTSMPPMSFEQTDIYGSMMHSHALYQEMISSWQRLMDRNEYEITALRHKLSTAPSARLRAGGGTHDASCQDERGGIIDQPQSKELRSACRERHRTKTFSEGLPLPPSKENEQASPNRSPPSLVPNCSAANSPQLRRHPKQATEVFAGVTEQLPNDAKVVSAADPNQKGQVFSPKREQDKKTGEPTMITTSVSRRNSHVCMSKKHLDVPSEKEAFEPSCPSPTNVALRGPTRAVPSTSQEPCLDRSSFTLPAVMQKPTDGDVFCRASAKRNGEAPEVILPKLARADDQLQQAGPASLSWHHKDGTASAPLLTGYRPTTASPPKDSTPSSGSSTLVLGATRQSGSRKSSGRQSLIPGIEKVAPCLRQAFAQRFAESKAKCSPDTS